MDACHILLGRPWQYDINYIHSGRAKTTEFDWMSRRVVLLLIGSSSKTKLNSKKGKQLFSVIKGNEFLHRKTEPILAFFIKENNISHTENHIPSEITNLLLKFLKIIEPTTSLPPLRNKQHTIDLMPGSTLPNLLHY